MLTTFMFMLLQILAPFSIGVPIMLLLMGKDTASEILSLIPIWLAGLVFVVVFCCILNLVTLPFTKHTVFLYDHHFSRGNTEVKYRDVTRIELDTGLIGRGGGNEPCCLDCYAGKDLLISIEHPSLLMTFLVIKRCKTAKLRYKRVKMLVFLWVLDLLMSIVFGICGAYGVQL